jgi:glycosyltransferase involved in cell wall biosynthesis
VVAANSDSPGVSVIVPLYNKVRTVGRAIRSILAQTGVTRDVIIVDDGSTDGSDAVVREFGEQVRYVRQANAGPSAARNRGFRESRQPVVTFLDADDELLPGSLAAHVRCRLVRPDVALTFGSFRIYTGTALEREEYIPTRSPELHEQDGCWFGERFLTAVMIAQQSSCIDRALFERVEGFDEGLRCWERSEFHFRVMLEAGCYGVAPGWHIIKHQDVADNSQFVLACGKKGNLARFANRVLDRIHRLPADQQREMIQQVGYVATELLGIGEYGDFKTLVRRMIAARPDAPVSARTRLLARLPVRVLEARRAVKR